MVCLHVYKQVERKEKQKENEEFHQRIIFFLSFLPHDLTYFQYKQKQSLPIHA